jgi:hypothetical protein
MFPSRLNKTNPLYLSVNNNKQTNHSQSPHPDVLHTTDTHITATAAASLYQTPKLGIFNLKCGIECVCTDGHAAVTVGTVRV